MERFQAHLLQERGLAAAQPVLEQGGFFVGAGLPALGQEAAVAQGRFLGNVQIQDQGFRWQARQRLGRALQEPPGGAQGGSQAA